MSRRIKKTGVLAERRSTISGRKAIFSQQIADKRKANELGSSDDLLEPAKRRPPPSAGSGPLPANSSGRTSLCKQLANRAFRGRSDVRNSTSRTCRSASTKLDVRAHSILLGPVRNLRLIRDNQEAHVKPHVLTSEPQPYCTTANAHVANTSQTAAS